MIGLCLVVLFVSSAICISGLVTIFLIQKGERAFGKKLVL